ncbi:hypothetical protein ACOME3_005246 [Neoechinorhynchus agilis]
MSARDVCEQTYDRCPELLMTMNGSTIEEGGEQLVCPYIPSHLHLMAFELMKNSIKATLDHGPASFDQLNPLFLSYTRSGGLYDSSVHLRDMTKQEKKKYTRCAPIQVNVVKGPEDFTIRISDQGGGVPIDVAKKMFDYMYTTARDKSLAHEDTLEPHGVTPLAGYGCGLPLSRLYARYLNGDLRLVSIEGIGTHAYIYLKTIPVQASERVPIYDKKTKQLYARTETLSQWTDGS